MVSLERLAVDGGTPVCDGHWPAWPAVDPAEWDQSVGPRLREVYLSRTEGLPGPQAEALAGDFAAYTGTRHAVLTPHGTDAIMAGLAGVLDLDGLGSGGEVICPDYTFVATASAALFVRCKVAFADIDRRHYTLDPAAVEAMIGPETTAILTVHLGGQASDLAGLRAVAEKHGLALIEDCAQAHGAEWHGARVGSLSAAGCFSFQSSKNLTSGEGGMVTCDDDEIHARVHSFMNVGRRPGGERWEYPRLGWNYRPSEYIAALLHSRLGLLAEQTARRNANALHLDGLLREIGGLTPPERMPWCTAHAYHLYMCRYDPDAFGGHTRGEFLHALGAEGVPCSTGYTQPLSDEDGFRMVRERYPDQVRVGDNANTRWVAERSVWLFQNLLLAERDGIERIAAAVDKIRRAWSG